jgi:hypothetical protein
LGLLIFEKAALAWPMAAIWGLHPLLTEAVTNIVGRADLLAAFGVFAGLLCHVKASTSIRHDSNELPRSLVAVATPCLSSVLSILFGLLDEAEVNFQNIHGMDMLGYKLSDNDRDTFQ